MSEELKVLRRITASEVRHTPDLVERISVTSWTGKLDAEAILREIQEARLSAWSVGDGLSGLALLRVEESPTRRTLLVDGLAGHNVVTKAQAIGRDLKTIARHYGCTRIEGTTVDARWAAVCKRIGFAPVSTTYEMEIS